MRLARERPEEDFEDLIDAELEAADNERKRRKEDALLEADAGDRYFGRWVDEDDGPRR